MQTINWTDFNALKQDAFDAKTEQEWQAVKHRYEEMVETYDKETRKYFKDKTVPQLQTLYEKKQAYWEKRKQQPTIVKNNFILRPEEGAAFTRLCNALADYISRDPRFATSLPPRIDFQGEGGGSVHDDGKSASEGTKTTQAK